MKKGIAIAKKCNITYHSLGTTCRSAMPIGNGELAASVWSTQDGKIEMYLSRSDARSEIDRTLKLGKVVVDIQPNPFVGDTFTQTLDLTEGSITLTGTGGFCKIFTGVTSDSLYMSGTLTEKCAIQARYETWRTDEFICQDEFSNERVAESKDTVQELEQGTYFFHQNGANIIKETLLNQSLEECESIVPDFLSNRIFGGIVQTPVQRNGNCFEISIHTRSAQESEAEFQAHLLELCAQNIKIEDELSKVKEKWQEFWAKSYIEITGDPAICPEIRDEVYQAAKESSEYSCNCESAITRAYTLTKYMMACCSDGAFPMLYNGLLFQQEPADGMHFQVFGFGKSFTGQPGELSMRSNPDERSWSREQLWQNLRHLYLVLPMMGEVDKLKVMFRYYKNFWDINRARAKKYYGAKGQHNTEMTLSFGLQNTEIYGKDRKDKAIGWADNRWGGAVDISPGLELVSMMLDYYDYTKDEEFLKTELLVYAKELLQYIETRFPNRCDGMMVIGPIQSIETYWNTLNPTPIIAGMRAIVHRILAIPCELVDEYAYFKEYQGRIPKVPMTFENGKEILKPAMAYASERHNVEPPEYYAVFPFDLVKMQEIEKQTAVHTFYERMKEYGLFHPFILGNPPDTPSYSGWQYTGVVAARLGLTDICSEILVQNCSMTNPGYRFPAMWGPIYDAVPDADHGANIINLLQHMILQMAGDEPLVLPAFPKEWNVSYRLFINQDTVIEGNEESYEIYSNNKNA